jgi:hypothetical protein
MLPRLAAQRTIAAPGRGRMVGMILAVIVVAIIVLMVVKPGV